MPVPHGNVPNGTGYKRNMLVMLTFQIITYHIRMLSSIEASDNFPHER